MSAPAVDRSSSDGAPSTPPRRPKKKRAPGWVPNQHGAWAMLIAPYLIGSVVASGNNRFSIADIVGFALWIVGYFAFFATSLWLKSRRKARYLPPVRAYVLMCAGLGLVTLALHPHIWSWLLVFAPVLAVGLYFANRRDDRSIASGLITVAAACLMPAVVYSDGLFDFVQRIGTPQYEPIILIMVACFSYFFGTVLYVKTMIRERGHVGYLVASVVWHAVCAIAALAYAVLDGTWAGWALVAFFVVATARAWVMPMRWPMRDRVLRPGAMGVGELVATVALAAILIGAAI